MIADNDQSPRETITIEHYKSALFHGKTYKVSQYQIRSFKNDVTTLQSYKLGLTSNDLKRALTTSRFHTLPFGYRGEIFADLVTDADDTSNLDT